MIVNSRKDRERERERGSDCLTQGKIERERGSDC